MRHSSIRLLIAALAVGSLAFLPALASSPADIPQVSSVFASPDLPHPLTADRLTRCIAETSRAFSLDDRESPQIIVLQFSPAEARRLGVSSNHVLNNNGPAHPGLFYEVWLVGPNSMSDLALGVVTVFEMHFGLKLTPKERAAVLNRVLAHLNTTVDVKTLRDSGTVGR